MLNPVSLIIPALVLLPNLIFFRTQPSHLPAAPARENRVLALLEGIGRVAVFVIPLFAPIPAGHFAEHLALAGMALAIGWYYYGWLRYFRSRCDYRKLFAPLAGIPVPLALAPVGYFLCAAAVLHSPALFSGAVVLALGHIPISLNTYRRIVAEDGRPGRAVEREK